MSRTPWSTIQLGSVVGVEQAERIADRLEGGAGPIQLDFRATREFERGALAVLAKALRCTNGRNVQVLGLTRDNRRLLAYLGVHAEKDAPSPSEGDDDA